MNPFQTLAPALLAAATPLLAANGAMPFADPAMIDVEVARFAGMPVGAPGGAAQGIDRRLKLAECRNPLSVAWYAGRRDTVLVQCPDPGSWRLFVPMLQGQTQQTNAVLRGEAVTIAVEGDGFSVTQPGEALEAGPVNAWIRVKSLSGNAEAMRARVVRPGLVRVDLGSDLP